MDATASSKVDADINDVYALFLKIENTDFPTPFKQRSTVIKYTKLPEFSLEHSGPWPRKSYSLQPRLRRIITLEEPATTTSRSLKITDPLFQSKTMANNFNKRKIVTISEDDEYDLHPKFSKDSRKSSTITSNRSVGTDLKREGKLTSRRSSSRLNTTAKCLNETRPGTKINKANNLNRHKTSSIGHVSIENVESKNPREQDIARKNKSVSLSRTSVSKSFVSPSESELELSLLKAKLCDNMRTQQNTLRKHHERPRKSKSPPSPTRSKASILLEACKNRKSLPVIHVPLDEKKKRNVIGTEMPVSALKPTIMVYAKSDGTMDTEIILHKDMNTGTNPLPCAVDQVTDMEGFEPEIVYKCIESTDVQTDLIKETLDKLDIPNVSLKKDESKSKEKLLNTQSKSLPDLQIPTLKITDKGIKNSLPDNRYCKSTSYIISSATLTYRTKQKINIQVVGNNDNAYSNQSPSPLTYPMNVVSVFREEMNSKDTRHNILMGETHESKSSKEYKNSMNEIKSLHCSYDLNSNKLMKPSDIISTIRVNNGLLQSVYMCEQFQREVNFIDSFFESLQYLESCSLSEKCFENKNIDQLVNDPALLNSEITVKNSEYDSLLSKLENGGNSDDSETMASKNLLLLNILIRDEQRRAKNLLCVLKKREDALKDFTKSQILYLENKKKQDNTDISALKKKQRGALLKLQHECGEMQRMRKALLMLSERRKVALMKTKKDLELKLKNNVDVEQIILGKKKLKRNASVDRTSVPLKCFDLSSSGCEDSTTSPNTSEGVASPPELSAVIVPITSAEKSIQTSDTILETSPVKQVNRSTDTAAENFVVVDGGYLNILFHNLSLPQIFSSCKQYEVNEVAMKNIVDSTNTVSNENWSDFVDKFVEQMKNDDDDDKLSTPSTARSLVEEFEQYYRTLAEEDRTVVEDDKLPDDVIQESPPEVYETCDAMGQMSINKSPTKTCTETMVEDSVKVSTYEEVCEECDISHQTESNEPVLSPTGPLPVPPGAADIPEEPVAEVSATEVLSLPSPKSSDTTFSDRSASSQPLCELASSASSLPEPAHAEAEELRRQQLAIEREIKELEQQQSRLLVVREIPDKPPPPYTPPAEARAPAAPRPFVPDQATIERLREHVVDPDEANYDPANAFEVLVHDFCQESIDRNQSDTSEKPWDACNLLPQKPPPDPGKVLQNTTELCVEVLSPATPSIISGVSSRRSDHIDDILFAEWRRVEPEWTSLHTDEAHVKNQLFETIFQRILTETVDEYKRTVLSPEPD